jgi:hypothetical protein
MPSSLKPLGEIFQPKPTEPRTTPSLREALSQPVETIDSYKVTPTLRSLLGEILEKAVHRKGQGYWIRAEYGAGKTHFIAALTTLLTNREADVWAALRDESLRAEYQAAMGKVMLFPVTFSLLGAGEADAADSLVRCFEKEVRDALPAELRKKVPVLSEELAAEWFESQAGGLIRDAIASYFQQTHKLSPDAFRDREGTRQFGSEILKVVEKQGIAIDLKGSFRERFSYLYDRITKLGGYDGLLFVVDEFRSWQDRHEGEPTFEEGVQLLETLAYYLPVEEQKNILLLVASQGDCPQKLMGSGEGDRLIVRELLKEQTDYGDIVCFRVRDIQPGREIEIEEYDQHCRKTFKFLKSTKKDYFRAIFPFQPQCFDILRRITQSYDRYGLPAARSGIHIAYEAITYNGLLASRRLAVPSDLLRSETLGKGLRSEQFRSTYETYETIVEELSDLPLDDDERDLARRIIGTLYLWGLVHAETSRFMPIEDLAEATLAELGGLHPKDAVLDLIGRLKADIPQIKYEKDKGARFEAGESTAEDQPQRAFPNFKKKAKANTDEQDRAWRDSLFWDFKDVEGVGEGSLFDGLGKRDAARTLVLPNVTSTKATPSGLKVQYGGEIVVADRWAASLGEPWPNKPEVHFRIVYLTSTAELPKSELQDPRIAVCCPATLSEDTRDALAEYVACNRMLDHYNDRDHPGKGAFRDWAKNRRREAMKTLLAQQATEYRRGAIVTQKEIGLPANQYFLPTPKNAGRREEALAAALLEKAYDAPLFTPKEFKKPFTEADARKVFNGLFAKSPSGADTSARDNFAPGLGLVAKNDLGQLAPQAGSAVVRIQERLSTAKDIPIAELIKELCRPPHGLTEELVRLAILCAVRAGTPPLMIAELNPSAGFKLTNDKEPPGKRLTARQIGQVEWGTKLEKALLGARLKLSDEKSFNEVLPYARVLNPNLPAVHSADDEAERNRELLGLLGTFADDLAEVLDTLKKLAKVLEGQVDAATLETFQRLQAIAATGDYQEFHAVARENYPSPEEFKAACEMLEHARKLTARYPDLQSCKSYLDDLADLKDEALAAQAELLRAQLSFPAVWGGDVTKLGSFLEQFERFRERYGLAYRKAHRDHHEQLEAVLGLLVGLEVELTVIERLNALDLGGAIGANLSSEAQALRSRVRPCALKDSTKVVDQPRCVACDWDGTEAAPREQAEALARRVTEASGDLCKRVAQEAVRKVLEASEEPGIGTLIDMATVAQVTDLAHALTPDMVERVKGILAAANVEHWDLGLAELVKQVKGGRGEEDVVGHDVIFNVRKPLLRRPSGKQVSDMSASDGHITHVVAREVRRHLEELPGRIRLDPSKYSDEHRTTPFLNTMLMTTLIPQGVNVEQLNLPFIESVCSRFFKKVDNRWYLPEQAVGGPSSGKFFEEDIVVSDETSAIQWLNRLLGKSPMRIGELRPHWMRATVKLTSDLSTQLERILRENFWLDRATRRWRPPSSDELAQLHNVERERACHDAERFLSGKMAPPPADRDVLSWIGHLYDAAALLEEEAKGLVEPGEEPTVPPEAIGYYGMMTQLIPTVLKENVDADAYTRASRQCRAAARKLEEHEEHWRIGEQSGDRQGLLFE